METTALGVALLAACLIASSVVIAAGFRRLDAHDASDRFLRIVGAAGISAVGSVVLELMHAQDPSAVLRAGADLSVALGPIVVWTALRTLRGPAGLSLLAAAVAAAAVAVASAVVPRPWSFGVLVGVLAVFCVAGVAETFRAPLRSLRGAVPMRVALGAFAVYALTVVGTGIAAGWTSRLHAAVTSWAVWTAVSGTAILLAAIAAFLVSRDLRRRMPLPTGAVAEGDVLRASIPDFDLMPAALGGSVAEYLDEVLLRVARDLDAGARRVRRGTVELRGSGPRAEVERRMQAGFTASVPADGEAVVESLVFLPVPR